MNKRNLLWVHWIPTHDQTPYLDYIKRLQPGGVKIINFDVSQVSKVYELSPDSLIMLREHSLSEQKAEMYADPVGTALRHVQWWDNRIKELYRQAEERRLPMPPKNKLILLGINEPEVWNHLNESIIYNIGFLDGLTVLGYTGGALNLSVGWPTNTGKDTPPNWEPYAPIRDAIVKGGHYLVVHEYWGYRGPEAMWGWHAGRFTKCPWNNVKIIVGECGVDNHVDDGSGNRGWKHALSSQEYALQVEKYIKACNNDPRFIGGALFTSDYGSRDWETFNSLDAHADLLTRQWTYEIKQQSNRPPKLHMPFMGNFPITQTFGENSSNYAPLKGHTGIDFACPINTPILAADDGVVTEAYELEQLGRYIKIVHQWGESVYLHLNSQKAVINQLVKGGEIIGYSGNTGRSTGPHLHFGIRIFPYNRNDGWDGYSDPYPYLFAEQNVPTQQPDPAKPETPDRFVYQAHKGTTLEIKTEYPLLVKVNDRYSLILNP